MLTFSAFTALPWASRNWIVGCCGNGTPLWGLADGGRMTASCVAEPATVVIDALVPVMPPVAAVTVAVCPDVAAVVNEIVATPLVLVVELSVAPPGNVPLPVWLHDAVWPC